jgi:hydrogenase maturation factor
MSHRLAAGKLPVAALAALVGRLGRNDPRLLVGPRAGEDAAVLDFGDRALVVATDPVTFATGRIGSYAVHVNANDVAVLGARPRWFFVVLLLPEGAATVEMADAIMADVVSAADALDVTVCGGHTEITLGLVRPIVIGQMLGDVAKSRLVDKARLAPGDEILLTRTAAIEGTAILAREKRDALTDRLAPDLLARAARLLVDPGISVVDAALTASAAAFVHGMHDPTEGGILGGLVEMAGAAGAGLRVFADRIPVLPETRAVCAAFDLDPLALIASGALLVGAPPQEMPAVTSALAARGIPSTIVAEVRPAGDGLISERDGVRSPLVAPDRDEIARVFERSTG